MTIKEITFEFENCEVVTFDGKYVGDFCAKNFEREIARQASNWIDEEMYCGHFEIELNKLADSPYECWGQRAESKFKRIMQYNDITHFTVVLYDQYAEEGEEVEIKEFHYAFDYNAKSEALGADNLNQQSYVSKLGNLYIVIDEKCATNSEYIFDVFDKELINDKDYMDFLLLDKCFWKS